MKPSRSRTLARDSFSLEPGIFTVSNMAELALRIRVSMSAMGSVIVMAAYQLAFVTPGTSPACTITRRQMRQSPNLRYTALGRPHRWHRVYPRTLNLGVRCCFSIKAFFAMVLPGLLSERKAERCQERPSFLVGACGRDDGDVHAARRVDLVVVDLGEYQLLGHPEGVVAAAVERPGGQPSEVSDTRNGQTQQAVEELPGPVAPQGRLDPDGLALTQLEAGDRLLGPGDDRLLAGDGLEVALRPLNERGLLGGAADAHVDDDLLQPRDLHDVAQAQPFLQAVPDLAQVPLLQPGARRRARRTHSSDPHFLQKRTFSPSSSNLYPARVGLSQLLQTSATVETCTGMNLSITPPCWVARVGLGGG